MPLPIDGLQVRMPCEWQSIVEILPRPAGRLAGATLDLAIMSEMQETPEQYQARLQSYVAGRDPIEMLRAAPDALAELIEGAPEELLSRRPAEGKWSVRAILAHMAEDELTSSWRYRQMIEHTGATLLGFDQDLWARLGDYESWPAADALAMFRLLREANLRMFGLLTAEEWQRHGVHAERGRITVEELARHMAAHDVNHILQVRRCLQS